MEWRCPARRASGGGPVQVARAAQAAKHHHIARWFAASRCVLLRNAVLRTAAEMCAVCGKGKAAPLAVQGERGAALCPAPLMLACGVRREPSAADAAERNTMEGPALVLAVLPNVPCGACGGGAASSSTHVQDRPVAPAPLPLFAFSPPAHTRPSSHPHPTRPSFSSLVGGSLCVGCERQVDPAGAGLCEEGARAIGRGGGDKPAQASCYSRGFTGAAAGHASLSAGTAARPAPHCYHRCMRGSPTWGPLPPMHQCRRKPAAAGWSRPTS